MPNASVKVSSEVNKMATLLFSMVLVATPLCTAAEGLLKAATEVPETRGVSAVSGGDASLPCDTRVPAAGDALLLVVWYRTDTPIYSYDSRVSGAAAHWAEEALEGRARWQVPAPSALHLSRVRPADAADYRCRVDFLVSPTRNYRIALDVVEPPGKPAIFDEYGKELTDVAGPYSEGGYFQLTCVVEGGKPAPRLRWWRGDDLLADSPGAGGSVPGHHHTLQLLIHNLTREHLHAVYTCSADNTPLAPPLRRNVNIELYLRPLTVEILRPDPPLSAGREATLSCSSTGARPPATLTWWLDNRQLTSVDKQQNSEDGNETVSVLRWTPKQEHHGIVLTCRAEHRTLNRTGSVGDSGRGARIVSSMKVQMQLEVFYIPIVKLQLGSKLNPNDIEEGDDVYFECVVHAFPDAYKIVWEHNGHVMHHKSRAGVITGGPYEYNLALQGVSRQQAGYYTCTASNVEGDGRSDPVQLQVIYTPVCRTAETVVVGVALQEAARVLCEVDAHPPPDSFQWTLNNSAGAFHVDPARYTVDKAARSSTLTYAPAADADYGSLACRASNLAGQQRAPCRYTLRPAARPDPLRDCTAANLTDHSLQLRCDPGYDGGLKALYVAEAWSGGILVNNASSSVPTWTLQELGAARALRLIIYAVNRRGRSEVAILRARTLPAHSPRTDEQSGGQWDVGWAMGGLAGSIFGALFIISCLAVLAAVRLRKRPSRQYNTEDLCKSHKTTPQTTPSPLGHDDKNPDVVPLNQGCSVSPPDRPPEPPPYTAAPPPQPPPPTSHSSHSLRAHTAHTHEPYAHTAALTLPLSRIKSDVEQDRRYAAGANGIEWRGGGGGGPGGAGSTGRLRREIVTTRTPLLVSAQPESCV